MKFLSSSLLLLFIYGNLLAGAYEKNSIDSLATKQLKSTEKTVRFTGKKYNVIDDIKRDLKGLMDRYISSTNTQETWKKVNSDATNLLMGYYKSGKLVGTKPEQAFFVKIGNDTMTSEEIKNGKMILLAGVATIKPTEFDVLRFERTVTGKRSN